MSHVDQEALDELVDRATKTSNPPRFIPGFHPQSSWLWQQWNGTVLQQTWRPAVTMMLLSIGLILFMEPVRAKARTRGRCSRCRTRTTSPFCR